MRNLHFPAVCDTDPDDLTDGEVDQILDLVYLDVYVHFTTQRVRGVPDHTTSSFAMFGKGGNRTRRKPLGIKGYQVLDTGWGLGRIRAQERGNLDSAVDPVPPDSTNLGIHDENSPVHQERGVGDGATCKRDRLDLQTNMTHELSHMNRDWNGTKTSCNRPQPSMEGAFNTTVKSMSNFRTRAGNIRRRIAKFRADEVAWEQHGTARADLDPPDNAPGFATYFVKDYPMINPLHDFTRCKQAQGESFKTWWERKKAMAAECDLEAMKGNDWIRLELVRGVSDTGLQERLLQEQQAALPQLVLIAKQWQVADGTQTVFGSDSREYVRQVSEYNRESTEYVRKASDYKHQIKENWKQDRQTNDRRSLIGE